MRLPKSALLAVSSVTLVAALLPACNGAPPPPATRPAAARPADEGVRLASLVTKASAGAHLVGVTVASERGGRVVFEHASGEADAAGTALTSRTTVRIGSITKSFTAVAVLQLIEARRLAFQDPVGRHVPALPSPLASVTLEQLLRHTSGIVDYADLLEADAALEGEALPRERLLELYVSRPLAFAPGTRWQYSNSNYDLLARVIEAKTGKPWARIVEEGQVERAGLVATKPCWETSPGGVATGFVVEDGRRAPAAKVALENAYAAGSLCSTPSDLVRWMRALVSGKLVSRSLANQAWSMTRLPDGVAVGYGMGFGLGFLGRHATIGHAGGIRGFSAQLLYVPESDSITAVVTNTETPHTARIARAVALEVDPSASRIGLGRPPPVDPSIAGDYRILDRIPLTVALEPGGVLVTVAGKAQRFSHVGEGHFCGERGCADTELSFLPRLDRRSSPRALLDKDGLGIPVVPSPSEAAAGGAERARSRDTSGP